MQVGDILDDVTLDVATGCIEITHVDIDSRACVPGSLFFAMPGASTSGLTHVHDAVAHGALCVVASEPVHVGVPVLVVPATQLRALCAHASASVVGHPEMRTSLVGVTGTNGKTSVTSLVASLARGLAWNGANIGTLTNERTTPAAPELFRTLASLVGEFDPAVQHSVVAMEVSSHAIDQQRIDGLRFTVAAFTNLSHEHLDYHGSMEAYFTVKATLFTNEHAQRAVIWTDDEYGERLAASTTLPVTRVSREDATDVENSLKGTTFFWRNHLINSPLIGDYNVDNALTAMTIMSVLGADDQAVAAAMGDVPSISGRFEVVRGPSATVIVDYAHTPDALRRLLHDVRAVVPDGRIITVFGCGGDRDRAKRPEMGTVAALNSDLTIVTSDNPRSESPDAIIDEVMSGVPTDHKVQRTTDRRAAIAQALAHASLGDVVVIAGKGHETTQTIGELVVAFNDRDVALELMR